MAPLFPVVAASARGAALTDVDGERRITLTPQGSRWQARWDDIAGALAQPAAEAQS